MCSVLLISLDDVMTWPESSKSYAHQKETTGSSNYSLQLRTFPKSKRSGSVVECETRDQRAAGSSLIGVTAL